MPFHIDLVLEMAAFICYSSDKLVLIRRKFFLLVRSKSIFIVILVICRDIVGPVFCSRVVIGEIIDTITVNNLLLRSSSEAVILIVGVSLCGVSLITS
jgi:hypothetical protein